MKKILFGLIATVTMSISSFGQDKITISASVSNEEYKSLDENEKRLSDYLSSAIASLQALELNGKDYSNYEAIVHFSNLEKDTLGNGIVISLIESNAKAAHGSCKVCGMSSAISCIKKIKNAGLGDDYDIHVHNDGGGCVTLSW